MNQKTLNTLINIAGICLGAAGLVFLLLSIFAGKDTLVWGLLCVALGNGLRGVMVNVTMDLANILFPVIRKENFTMLEEFIIPVDITDRASFRSPAHRKESQSWQISKTPAARSGHDRCFS